MLPLFEVFEEKDSLRNCATFGEKWEGGGGGCNLQY